MKYLLFLFIYQAANWYVAVNGSDQNPGTQSLPLATLQKANDLASNGDTILVNDGIYSPTTGSTCCNFMVYLNKSNLTFKAINRRSVILDDQFKNYSIFYCGANVTNITIQGFIIKNGFWSGIAAHSGGCTGLKVLDNEIGPICTRSESSQTGCTGIWTDNGASGTIDSNYIHNIGRTNDAGNTYDHGVYTLGSFSITNNTIIPYNGWAIQTAGSFTGTISNNTINGPVQFDNKPGQIMLWGNNGPIVIANNISTGARGSFLTSYAWSSPNCQVYSNLVSGVLVGSPVTCNINLPSLRTVIINGQVFTLPLTIQ